MDQYAQRMQNFPKIWTHNRPSSVKRKQSSPELWTHRPVRSKNAKLSLNMNTQTGLMKEQNYVLNNTETEQSAWRKLCFSETNKLSFSSTKMVARLPQYLLKTLPSFKMSHRDYSNFGKYIPQGLKTTVG